MELRKGKAATPGRALCESNMRQMHLWLFIHTHLQIKWRVNEGMNVCRMSNTQAKNIK